MLMLDGINTLDNCLGISKLGLYRDLLRPSNLEVNITGLTRDLLATASKTVSLLARIKLCNSYLDPIYTRVSCTKYALFH